MLIRKKYTAKIVSVLLFFSPMLYGQRTIGELERFIIDAPFFDSDKRDSLLVWSARISEIPHSPRAKAYTLRMKGLHEEFKENIPEATAYFLQFLALAKVYQNSDDEMSATGDLVYIYITTKQYETAKQLLLPFTSRPDLKKLNQKKLSIFYNNLGICYNNLNKLDSAVIVYQKALNIKESLNDKRGIANLRINMSNLLVKQKRFQEAFLLTRANLEMDTTEYNQDLWYNLGNMGGILSGLNREQEAESYLKASLQEAQREKSTNHIWYSHSNLSAFYADKRHYKKAYESLTLSNDFNKQLINENTNKKIAELKESFDAGQRELDNLLLGSKLRESQSRQRAYLLGLASLALFTVVAAWAFHKNRKQNRLIQSQNEGLVALNREKNHLMSIVSHDLSSPFTAIKLWSEVAMKKKDLHEIRKIQSMIHETTLSGLKNIKKILSIDEKGIKDIDLKETNLSELLRTLVDRFKAEMKAKTLELHVSILQDRESILSDHGMLQRALVNLFSNAIKYSKEGGQVFIKTYENANFFHFEFKDEGIGIAEEEQSLLFERYGQTSAKPTFGESSHGLGLSIVKRIAEELGGRISFESKKNEGSSFTFSIPLV